MTKLVYIGGYGRSGSTLLEYLLTAQPNLVACGEVERHLRRFGKRKICTCGRRLKKCPVWGSFQHKSGKLKGWDHEQLALALLEHVSHQYAVMTDLSKTAWGSTFTPFRLFKRLGENFLLVHLVRDPRAVAWSTMRSPRRQRRTRKGHVKVRQKSAQASAPGLRSLRTTAGWTLANLACDLFGWRHPDRYLKVRYEDFVRTPIEVIEQILNRASLGMPASLDPAEESSNRHQLYGNAMRFEELKIAELKEDVAWKTTMPAVWRSLVGWITWPLRGRYRYGRVEQS